MTTRLAELSGEVIEPDSPEYDAAHRSAFERFHHIRPRAVIRCASAQDVARTLEFAARSGLPVVPRGGGHCFAGRSSTDGLVLDLTPMRSISVSGNAIATIGAGARLAEVYDGLHAHGLTLPAGCGPTVGIAGLTLGGGLGLLGRRYGLTCDRLLAAQVVLTDGRIVDCAEDREPDLFWALRGAGGGQFGVVTSLVFAAVPEPRATRFVLTWPWSAAADLVAAWQRWAPDAPDELTACLRITPADGPMLFGAMLGSPDRTEALLGELIERVGAGPRSRQVAELTYRHLKRSLDGLGSTEPEEPVISRSEFFGRPLPADAIAELLNGHDSGTHRELNFTPMGGAYNRVPPGATAFAHRGERFLLEHVGPEPWARRSWAIAHRWGSGRVYPNFPDPDLTDWAQAYHGDNHARLTRVKRTYDPGRLLHFPQSV